MAKYLDKSGVTYLWNKIKGLFTDQSLNTKNKTYAGAINEINTKVGNLTGAFLWKGKFNTLPAVTNYEAGNVVGVGKKEYVLTVTEGTKTWEEFGDEGSYLLKTAAEETYLKKTAGEVKTANLADNAVTSTKLATGARKPIIITGDMTEVDEETYQKLLSNDVDVVFKAPNEIIYPLYSKEQQAHSNHLILIFAFPVCLTGPKTEITDGVNYTVRILPTGNHSVIITENIATRLSNYLSANGYVTGDVVYKKKLSPVLQEIDLTGTDADRKAKLDKFETDWKALTGATNLIGARFVGKFVITDDIERNVTGIMTYFAGDTATEANDNCFYGICNGYSFGKQKSQIAVKVSCTDGSLTITPLFSHLEAIAIKTGNTPDVNAANVAAINAYVDNLKALGVDTTKGYEIPILYNSDSKGFIGYNPNAASSFNGYAVTPEGNLHTLTMNATTGALSNKILATTAITDALSTNKQPKTDAALKTTSKTVTGAINEVNDKTVYMAFTDVTKLSTNLGKRLIYKGGNVTLSSPITINSNINEIDFNGTILTVDSLAKTGISVITGHSHCIIKNLIISGTWSVNTGTVNNIIDTFSGVENVSVDVTINGTHYGRGFHNCQRLTSCKSEIKGANITEGRAYNYCEYLYMCRVGANSKGTGFFHCTSMDSCDILNGGCIGSELKECSNYTKVSCDVNGVRKYFSDADSLSVGGSDISTTINNLRKIVIYSEDGHAVIQAKVDMFLAADKDSTVLYFGSKFKDKYDRLVPLTAFESSNGLAFTGYLSGKDNNFNFVPDVDFVRVVIYKNSGLWNIAFPFGKFITTTTQKLNEQEQNIAKLNIDAGSKAIRINYDDVQAAEAALTKYNEDPQKTVILVNYKTIRIPAIVSPTFIVAFVPEGANLRKLLYRHNTSTWDNSTVIYGDTIRYSEQTLTDAQKETVRNNIGIDVNKSYVDSALNGKQDALTSGTNIKTINGQSLLGSGNITISGGGDVTAAGDNTFTGNNVFSGIAIADILDGTQYQITGDNGFLMFASGATNDDIQLSGVATPTFSNSAANKQYVDDKVAAAGGGSAPVLVNIDDISGSAGNSVPVDVFNKIANAASAKTPIFGYSKLVNGPRTTYEIIPLYVKNVSTTGTIGSLTIQCIAENAYNIIGIVKHSDTECSILISSSHPFALATSVDKSSTRGIQSSAVWEEIHSEPMTVNTATSGGTILSSTDKHKILCYADSGTQQYNLPPSPVDGETFLFLKVKTGHAITIQSGTGNQNIYDCSSGNSVVSKTIATSTKRKITVTYSSTAGKWFLMADDFLS